MVVLLWMPPPDVPQAHRVPDKLVHFVLFLGVGAAWVRAEARPWVVIVAGVLLGALTEVGQGWFPWPRQPDVADFGFDVAGVLTGVLLASASRAKRV